MMRGWLAALGFAAMTWVTAAGCSSTVVGGTGCPENAPTVSAACSDAGALCAYQHNADCAMTYICGEDKLWAYQSSTCTAVGCQEGADGGYCAVVGESCSAFSDCGGSETICGADHTWSTTWYDEECCASAPSCPLSPPADGDSCDPCYDGAECAYPSTCGVTTASCGPDYVWVVTPGDCPPPAMEPCALFFDEATCATAPYCRWLVPGCGTPALPAPSCFPIADCTPGSCADPATTCQTVIHDPCYNKGCDACSAEVSVCLP